MVRIILKNGDILKYPDATRVKPTPLGIQLIDNIDIIYAVFNLDNIAGWDYEE